MTKKNNLFRPELKQWANETFPSFEIPEGFFQHEDLHNNAPSIVGLEMDVYVASDEQKQRETADRFTAIDFYGNVLLQTEDWDDVLDLITERRTS